MPRSFMFTKEQILQAAVAVAREKGFSAVTARGVGARLGTSSRPIFSYYKSMTELQNDVIAAACEIHLNYIKQDVASGKYPPYKASGMAYIRFAREEKELFKVLFMRDTVGKTKEKLTEAQEIVSELLCKQVNVTKEQAKLFYLEMWTYVHGIATMIVTDFFEWSEELASQTLTDMYQGLKYKYENQNKA